MIKILGKDKLCSKPTFHYIFMKKTTKPGVIVIQKALFTRVYFLTDIALHFQNLRRSSSDNCFNSVKLRKCNGMSDRKYGYFYEKKQQNQRLLSSRRHFLHQHTFWPTLPYIFKISPKTVLIIVLTLWN